MASRIRGEKLNMFTNPLNMYHRLNRIQKGEVNDPNRTSVEMHLPGFLRFALLPVAHSVATSTLIEGCRGQASPLGQG
jgi:hypothetical protein